MKRPFIHVLIVLLTAFLAAGCSLPPEVPVTRDQLMATGIYRYFIIQESPEEVLNALNKDGEAVIPAKRKIRGKDFPVYIKLLATSNGIEVVDYDR